MAGFHSVSVPTSHTKTNRLVPNAIADSTLATSRRRNARMRTRSPRLGFLPESVLPSVAVTPACCHGPCPRPELVRRQISESQARAAIIISMRWL